MACGCDTDAPGLLPCIIGGCDAVRLICPPVPGSVSDTLREPGFAHSHLVLYAAAAAAAATELFP